MPAISRAPRRSLNCVGTFGPNASATLTSCRLVVFSRQLLPRLGRTLSNKSSNSRRRSQSNFRTQFTLVDNYCFRGKRSFRSGCTTTRSLLCKGVCFCRDCPLLFCPSAWIDHWSINPASVHDVVH